MKVIDLLNKIANDEEVPEKIKWRDKIWTYDNKDQDYEINDTDLLGYGFSNHRTLDFINDEVEIIEEEKKIPEKLGYQDNADGTFYLNRKKYNSEPIKILSKKINEIINYLDYLESKGE